MGSELPVASWFLHNGHTIGLAADDEYVTRALHIGHWLCSWIVILLVPERAMILPYDYDLRVMVVDVDFRLRADHNATVSFYHTVITPWLLMCRPENNTLH